MKGTRRIPGLDTKAPVKNGIVFSPYPPLERRENETFYEYIKTAFLGRAALPALERNGEWLTFSELLDLIEDYASGFQSRGVACGSRVCVNMTNSAEAVAAIYALCCAGAAVVLTRPGLTERHVLYRQSGGLPMHRGLRKASLRGASYRRHPLTRARLHLHIWNIRSAEGSRGQHGRIHIIITNQQNG